MAKHGIDVSHHNGIINWEQVAPHIDFAMLRVGYGSKVDTRFYQNAVACNTLCIPFGAYWFSYALDEKEAVREATLLCDILDEHIVSYPVAFDYEEESYNYAVKCNERPSKELIQKIATAFLTTVESRGYYAIIYSNKSYLKYFKELTDTFDLWLARPGLNVPDEACGIWQYSFKGKVSGISTDVDLDISYNDYAAMIANKVSDETAIYAGLQKASDIFYDYYSEKYVKLAKDIIKGVYGNGKTRQQKIKQLGYDYTLVQMIVNAILGGEIA